MAGSSAHQGHSIFKSSSARSRSPAARGFAVKRTEAPAITPAMMAMFGLTYVAYIAMYFTRKPTSVTKTEIGAAINVTGDLSTKDANDAVAAVDTSFLVAYAVGQFSLGMISKRVAMRTYLTLAFLVSGVACFVFSTTNSVAVMSAMWALNGFAQSGANPLLVNYISDVFPASMRGSITGLWQTSQQVGGVASTTFQAYTLQQSTWQAVFYWSAVPALLSSAAIGLFLTSPTAPVTEPAADAEAKKPKEAVALEKSSSALSTIPKNPLTYSEVIQLRGVANVGFSYFNIKLVRYCLMFWLAKYLKEKLSLASAEAGYMSTTCDIGGTVGGVLSGMIADRLLSGHTISFSVPCCLLASAALALLGNASSLGFGQTEIAVTLALVGVFIAGPDATLGGAAAKTVVEYNGVGGSQLSSAASTASGIVNGIGSVGSALQGKLTVIVVAEFGWEGLFFGLSACMALAALSALPAARLEIEYKAKAKAKKE